MQEKRTWSNTVLCLRTVILFRKTPFFDFLEFPDGERRALNRDEKAAPREIKADAKIFSRNPLSSMGMLNRSPTHSISVANRLVHHRTPIGKRRSVAMKRLELAGRLIEKGNTLRSFATSTIFRSNLALDYGQIQALVDSWATRKCTSCRRTRAQLHDACL